MSSWTLYLSLPLCLPLSNIHTNSPTLTQTRPFSPFPFSPSPPPNLEVIKWFAERADMIIVMFDAHKLDISDELKTVLDVLKPHQDKIRWLQHSVSIEPHSTDFTMHQRPYNTVIDLTMLPFSFLLYHSIFSCILTHTLSLPQSASQQGRHYRCSSSPSGLWIAHVESGQSSTDTWGTIFTIYYIIYWTILFIDLQ